MKILFLTAVYPPLGYSGHDERCRQVAIALAGAGHSIQVLTSDQRLPPMGVPGEKAIFRELRLSVALADNSVLGKSYGAIYEHEQYNATSLDHRIRRFEPNVIYVFNMDNLSKSLLFRLEERGIRVVYDLHSSWLAPAYFQSDPWFCWWKYNWSARSRLYKIINRFIGRAQAAKNLMPIEEPQCLNIENGYVSSQWLKVQLIESGIEGAKNLPVIYPHVDTRKLTTKEVYESRKHFVWAGRLTDDKAPDLAVKAVALLKKRGIKVKLDIYGTGEPIKRKSLRETIERAGLREQISMRGIRPGEMVQHYAKFDALIYTNRRAEGFSMVVMEAVLSKLPCIVANIGGNQEILNDGEDALLYKAGSVEALADSMTRFMDLADNGKSLADQNFNSLKEQHDMCNFYQKIKSILSPTN